MIYAALLTLFAIPSALGETTNGFTYLSASMNKDPKCPMAQTIGHSYWHGRYESTTRCAAHRGCNMVSRNDRLDKNDRLHKWNFFYYCQNTNPSAIQYNSVSTKWASASSTTMRSYFNKDLTLGPKPGCQSRYGARRYPDQYGEQTFNRDYLANTNSWQVEFQFRHNTKNDHVGLVDNAGGDLRTGGFRIGFNTGGQLRWDYHTTNFGGEYRTGFGPVGDYRDGEWHDVVLTVEAGYGVLTVDGKAGQRLRVYDYFAKRAPSYTTKAYLGNDMCCGDGRQIDGYVQEFHLCALDNQPAFKKENRRGMRPNCPVATGFGACGNGKDCAYGWSTLETALNRCEKTKNCNVVSSYGSGSGTTHHYAYACPDLDNIEWVSQRSWGNGASSSYPYVATDDRQKLTEQDSTCTGVSRMGNMYKGFGNKFQLSELGSFNPGHDFEIYFTLNLRTTGNNNGDTIVKNTVAVGSCGFKYTLENDGYSGWGLHKTQTPASGDYADRYIMAYNNRVYLKDGKNHEVVLRLTAGKATVIIDGLAGESVDVPTLVADELWSCSHGIEIGNDDGTSYFRGIDGTLTDIHFCELPETQPTAACPDKPLSSAVLSLLKDPNNELLYSCRDGKCGSLSAVFADWEALDSECNTILGVDDDGALYGTDQHGAIIKSTDQGATFSGADLLAYSLDCGIHNAETGDSEVTLSYTNPDGEDVIVTIDQNNVEFDIGGSVIEYSNFYECL